MYLTTSEVITSYKAKIMVMLGQDKTFVTLLTHKISFSKQHHNVMQNSSKKRVMVEFSCHYTIASLLALEDKMTMTKLWRGREVGNQRSGG